MGGSRGVGHIDNSLQSLQGPVDVIISKLAEENVNLSCNPQRGCFILGGCNEIVFGCLVKVGPFITCFEHAVRVQKDSSALFHCSFVVVFYESIQ